MCPLDRVLTYKNLIYLLNLQFYCVNTKAVTGWSVFAIGVDLGRSRVLSGQPDSR